MADNVTVDNGGLTDYTVASDDDGTAQHQYVKLEYGADGTFTKVTATAPLPVSVSDGGNSITIDGTVQVSDGGNSLTVDGTVAATQSGTWTVGISDAGNSITVDGTVIASDGGSSLTVDGTVAATQSGAWTVVTSDGGNSLTVDGTVAATQSGAWTVGISDAGNSITVDGSVSLSGTPTVVISDGGNSITIDGSIAAGTEYTEGDVDATITGTAVMWEDTGDTLRAASAAKPFPVAIISGAGSGGTAIQDDTAFTPATTQVTPAGAMFDDVAPDSVDEGDAGVVRMSANRNLYTTIRDAAGNERGVNVTAGNALLVSISDGGNSITVDGTVIASDGGSSITVDGTVAATQSGSWIVITSDGGNSLTVDGTVQISDGGNSITVDGTVAATQSGTWTVITSDGGNSLTVDGTVAATQSGTWTVLTSDGGNSLTVDGTVQISDGGNSLTVDGTVAATQSGTWTVITSDGGNSLTVDGTVVVSDGGNLISVDDGAGSLTVDNAGTFVVQPRPEASGGLSIYRNLDIDEADKEVKATAGQVYGVWFTNTATATRWLKFYNATTGNTAVGTTTPVITIGMPGNSSDDITGLFGGTHGIAFGTAITVACTTGPEDSNQGAPATSDCVINVFYA